MKKFLEEKKRSLKFKLAGPGHKLNEPNPNNASSSRSDVEPQKPRVESPESQEKRSALLAAALQRTQAPPKSTGVQLRLKKQLAKTADPVIDTRDNEENANAATVSDDECSAPGVFFKCPDIDEALVLSRPEWEEQIKSHIDELKQCDAILGSILQIKSLNPSKEADECVTFIIRYLRNILDNPENEKYRSIRMGNPKFTEKVLRVDGALDFLLAADFQKEDVVDESGSDSFLKFKKESPSELEGLIQSLLDINGLQLQLYRDYKLLKPIDVANDSSPLPDDFFEITLAELKKQQQRRTTELERESTLMTKKMRELEKAKYARRKALFTRIRVRLPNDLVIQGTFSVKEPFRCLREFISEHVFMDSGFSFMSPPSYVYQESDDDKTFEELNLEPAVQLIMKTTSENVILKKEMEENLEMKEGNENKSEEKSFEMEQDSELKNEDKN